MEGTRVIIRAYGDEPRICVVYQVKNDTVFVTNQTGLAGIRSGQSGPSPIGFNKCDVYAYSLTAEMQIKRRQHDRAGFDWGQLKPFML
jgi:hypothetical protein